MEGSQTERSQTFTIQKIFIGFEFFAFSMVLVHMTRHFSHLQILTGYTLFFLVSLPIMIFAKRILTREFLAAAFVVRWPCLFIYVVHPSLATLYLYFILNGLMIFLFWVPYNIRFFTLSHPASRATSAAHLVIVGPILNTCIPAISGFVIIRLGYWYLIAGSTVLAALLVYKALRLPQFDIEYSFRHVMTMAKGMKSLKFVQGMWEAGSFAVSLYSLVFVSGELQFGLYLSYLGLFGVIGTLVVTRLSDRQNRRLKYFLPFVISLALLTISLPFMQSLTSWAVATGLLGIATTLTYPFFFAIVLDKIENTAEGMIAREFMLNAGRVVGYAIITATTMATGTMKWGFLFAGAILLVYPILLRTKKAYIEEDYNPLQPIVKMCADGMALVERNLRIRNK